MGRWLSQRHGTITWLTCAGTRDVVTGGTIGTTTVHCTSWPISPSLTCCNKKHTGYIMCKYHSMTLHLFLNYEFLTSGLNISTEISHIQSSTHVACTADPTIQAHMHTPRWFCRTRHCSRTDIPAHSPAHTSPRGMAGHTEDPWNLADTYIWRDEVENGEGL